MEQRFFHHNLFFHRPLANSLIKYFSKLHGILCSKTKFIMEKPTSGQNDPPPPPPRTTVVEKSLKFKISFNQNNIFRNIPL